MDFIITIHHIFPFISVATPQSIRNICTPKAKVVVLKRQLLELLRALRRIPPRIPLHRRLRSSSNSADQVLRLLLLRRTDELTLAGQTMKKKMLLRLWAENFDRLESREARKAWDDIAKKMNDQFGTKKTTDKYQK